MTLQTCAQEWLTHDPGFSCPWESLDLYPLFDELFALATQGRAAQARGAAMFHLALANGLAYQATLQARRHGTDTVVLGGGCFANTILRDALSAALLDQGLQVVVPNATACGDEGLALGQAWIATHSLSATRRKHAQV